MAPNFKDNSDQFFWYSQKLNEYKDIQTNTSLMISTESGVDASSNNINYQHLRVAFKFTDHKVNCFNRFIFNYSYLVKFKAELGKLISNHITTIRYDGYSKNEKVILRVLSTKNEMFIIEFLCKSNINPQIFLYLDLIQIKTLHGLLTDIINNYATLTYQSVQTLNCERLLKSNESLENTIKLQTEILSKEISNLGKNSENILNKLNTTCLTEPSPTNSMTDITGVDSYENDLYNDNNFENLVDDNFSDVLVTENKLEEKSENTQSNIPEQENIINEPDSDSDDLPHEKKQYVIIDDYNDPYTEALRKSKKDKYVEKNKPVESKKDNYILSRPMMGRMFHGDFMGTRSYAGHVACLSPDLDEFEGDFMNHIDNRFSFMEYIFKRANLSDNSLGLIDTKYDIAMGAYTARDMKKTNNVYTRIAQYKMKVINYIYEFNDRIDKIKYPDLWELCVDVETIFYMYRYYFENMRKFELKDNEDTKNIYSIKRGFDFIARVRHQLLFNLNYDVKNITDILFSDVMSNFDKVKSFFDPLKHMYHEDFGTELSKVNTDTIEAIHPLVTKLSFDKFKYILFNQTHFNKIKSFDKYVKYKVIDGILPSTTKEAESFLYDECFSHIVDKPKSLIEESPMVEEDTDSQPIDTHDEIVDDDGGELLSSPETQEEPVVKDSLTTESKPEYNISIPETEISYEQEEEQEEDIKPKPVSIELDEEKNYFNHDEIDDWVSMLE